MTDFQQQKWCTFALLDKLWTKMNVDEHLYFIRKLKNYMDEENIVSMEVNLQH
jgi:hypothetical protein